MRTHGLYLDGTWQETGEQVVPVNPAAPIARVTIHQAGEALIDVTERTANGRLTCAGVLGHGSSS